MWAALFRQNSCDLPLGDLHLSIVVKGRDTQAHSPRLISKRRDGAYQAGGLKHWVKVKNRTHPATRIGGFLGSPLVFGSRPSASDAAAQLTRMRTSPINPELSTLLVDSTSAAGAQAGQTLVPVELAERRACMKVTSDFRQIMQSRAAPFLAGNASVFDADDPVRERQHARIVGHDQNAAR